MNTSDPVAVQLAHFCEVIRERAEPLVSGPDGLATLAATEAVPQSAREDRPVRPADLDDIPSKEGLIR